MPRYIAILHELAESPPDSANYVVLEAPDIGAAMKLAETVAMDRVTVDVVEADDFARLANDLSVARPDYTT